MEVDKDCFVIIDEVSNRQIIVQNNLWETAGHSLDEYFINCVPGGIDALEAIRCRAEISEVVKFANAVREAGGGNLIDGLMPSTPQEPSSCLIANALNFDCEVNTNDGEWYMETDGEVGVKIAETLGLTFYGGEQEDEYDDYRTTCEIALPGEIGAVAEAFDSYCDYELEQYNEQNIAINSIR